MKPDFSPLSISDMEEIVEYIAQDNPDRAFSFGTELKEKCIEIAKTPKLYRSRSELPGKLRVTPYRDYVILYRETETAIRIERILHGARDYGELL